MHVAGEALREGATMTEISLLVAVIYALFPTCFAAWLAAKYGLNPDTKDGPGK